MKLISTWRSTRLEKGTLGKSIERLLTTTSIAAPLLFTLLLTAMTSSNAQALMRADCFNPSRAGFMGKKMGERNAARIVQAIWARLGQTCNNVDRVAQIISETPLAKPMRGGEFAACFFLGYTDALWNQIDGIYDRCGTQCFNTGSEVGHISAQGYCAASLAIGGLLDPGFISQPPLPFCGQSLVLGCKSEYISVATFQFPGCSTYTEGGFTDVFENSVRQDCFVPQDVPIRDGGGWLNFFADQAVSFE